MTILHGEHYVVESLHQLVERTTFDYYDVLEAVENSPDFEQDDFAREMNQIHEGEDWWDHADSVRDLHDDDVSELVQMYGLNDASVFIELLEQDYRDWVHLFDGTVHDIVEVYDE